MSIYLIIDCGTTNMRVSTVSAGKVIARASRPVGVRNTSLEGDNQSLKIALRDCASDALKISALSFADIDACIASGMITSNLGLNEIPHLPAPVSAKELKIGIKSAVFDDIMPIPIHFIPGVKNNGELMDMMRGEETETIGLYALLKPKNDCVFVLPGSHNKFVSVSSIGTINSCMTSISGELLMAITQNTIISDSVDRLLVSEEEYDPEMVVNGALECMKMGLGRAAFSSRLLNQLKGVEKRRLRSFILGAVISQDIIALNAFDPKSEIYVAGKSVLRRAFIDVLNSITNRSAKEISEEISSVMGITGAITIYNS